MIKNIDLWLSSYLKQNIACLRNKKNKTIDKIKILFTICDHFEPFWNNADPSTADDRTDIWMDKYPAIADRHRDFLGNNPKYAFFYPIEEYKKSLLNKIAHICHQGFGEVEIHLHHHDDNSDNLKTTLINYKRMLAKEHALLPINRLTHEIKYGFIHGNWALDNSRPDGKWCGVNDEISILEETGCYADFTMPSAPSDTQTTTINSIYYAIDDPRKPKSHNTGKSAIAGLKTHRGLLCIQGPLGLNFRSRKFGLLPRIENGALTDDCPISYDRIKIWFDQHVHVKGRPDIVFVKVYTHGTQESTIHSFFNCGELDKLYTGIEDVCGADSRYNLYYVTPRQMYNVVKGLEAQPDAEVEDLLEYELVLQKDISPIMP